MSNFFPEKYFSGIEIFETPVDHKKDLNKGEKIKLEFSIENPGKGSYSIQTKSYEGQVCDFSTEMKNSNIKETIKFEKFFVCDFKFQKIQEVIITISKIMKK